MAKCYRSEVGEMLLARMFDKKCDDYEPDPEIGIKMTKENVQGHLEKARRVFYRFNASSMGEVARFEEKSH